MRKSDYLKENANITVERLMELFLTTKDILLSHKKLAVSLLVAGLIVPVISVFALKNNVKKSYNEIAGDITLSTPIAASSSQKGVISIPTGMVKANPFVPYRDISGTSVVPDVPTFSLIEPPEIVNENSDAARVMDTIVSGILYDKFSPSAILNIEGNDYLVKKGDVVNNYKVVNIAQDSVTVKLGANVYKAGIGEILTEGTVNYNNVSNLNNKFGGSK